MNVTNIFTSVVAHDYLDIDIEQLKKFCYSEKRNTEGRVLSNYGGWQSQDYSLNHPELQEIASALNLRMNQLLPDLGFKNKYSVTNSWININGKNDFNRPHLHGASTLAAVFYVTAPPDSGRLVLRNPTQNHVFCIDEKFVEEWNEINSFTWEIEPEIGKLVIFPAWIDHYTMPNLTDDDRISLAFNILIHG